MQKLGTSLPAMGRKRIANLLARAGLHLSPSTVRRMRLAPRPVAPPPSTAPEPSAPEPEPERERTRVVRADYPHHVWHVDITTVVSFAGFWVPWFPQSLPISWPWAWSVVAVLDHFSRAPLVVHAFPKGPTSAELCRVLDRAIERAGCKPRYIVSDQGVQFRNGYRRWCRRHGVHPRFGALGQHGSIAVIERFFRSLKSEYLRCIRVPLARPAMQRELDAYVEWYTSHRPHEALGGATPDEVLRGALPAAGRIPFEPRARHPLARGDPRRFPRRRVPGRLELVVSPHERCAELPVVELREAA